MEYKTWCHFGTNASVPTMTMWKSDVYHLLSMCHAYMYVRILFFESGCLSYFLNFCKVRKSFNSWYFSTFDFSPLSYAWIVRVEERHCNSNEIRMLCSDWRWEPRLVATVCTDIFFSAYQNFWNCLPLTSDPGRVCGADVTRHHPHHTRPTQQLSRPPPIQKLGAESHMLQLNI